MKLSAALAGGLAGTFTVAVIHESLKKITADAPRMDILDIELVRKGFNILDIDPPEENKLRQIAIAGELFCDTAYYGLAALGRKKNVMLRGASLGLIAGVTAVILPKPLGLPAEPSSKTLATKLMTVGLYLLGGVVAAKVAQVVDDAKGDTEM